MTGISELYKIRYVKFYTFTGEKMPDLVRISLLYDFYGPFLTEKQREFFELHFFNDWSLSEIAENYGVTRQNVFDVVNRSTALLEEYEKKLGMVERFMSMTRDIERILKSLEELRPFVMGEGKAKLEKIYNELATLIKEGCE
ncbi:YlxM family DNA-binding protein [Thermovorax subterraneus]|nr:YlxM family DNA-binding protein [Thermovorax subterraneus]